MPKLDNIAISDIKHFEPLVFHRGLKDSFFLTHEKEKILKSAHGMKDYFSPRVDSLLPLNISENEAVRHFTRLSQRNFCIDTASYPLGSCSMKYNPKINEWIAREEPFVSFHPLMPEELMQPALKVCYDMQCWLSEIGGFHLTSLCPSAGAQGEFAGLCMITQALKDRKEARTTIMVPSSAHGTNPATAAYFGYKVLTVDITKDGKINLDTVKKLMDHDCAGIMITNPNTLGIFESDHLEIANVVHEKGGYIYGDGANLNAILGIVRPGDIGVDVMHFNLHKTFTTPHGGGGPGCGAIGASKRLAKYLPTPIITKKNNVYETEQNRPHSIGRIRSFYNNFGLLLRAYGYLKSIGKEHLKSVSQKAVLNANYIKHRLLNHYHMPYASDCLHEVVLSDKWQQAYGVSALDISKRLIDFGIHPPTMYFPLIVKGALMIEPTESENFFDLKYLVDSFINVAIEAKTNPEIVKSAPHKCSLERLNEAKAARDLIVTAKVHKD